jgi:hypothetical protein
VNHEGVALAPDGHKLIDVDDGSQQARCLVEDGLVLVEHDEQRCLHGLVGKAHLTTTTTTTTTLMRRRMRMVVK